MSGQDDETSDGIEVEVTDAGVGSPALKVPGARRAFARMRREMTDDELAHPAVQKMMMDELERLDREREELIPYRDKYSECDKQNAILTEKLKPKLAADIVFGGCTSIGSIMGGLSANFWSNGILGYFCLALGVILVLVGIFAKVVLR